MNIDSPIKIGVFCILLLISAGCPDVSEGTSDSTVLPDFSGPAIRVSVSSQDGGAPDMRSIAYACWIEDENGLTLQPLRITSFHFGVSGCALPIWNRTAGDTQDSNNVGAKTDLDYSIDGPDKDEIDAVTSATEDGDFTISRPPYFDISSVRKFYILFEVDRSYNSNDYFPNDRPSMLYKSALIDMDNLQSEYPLSLAGWMCNDSLGTIGTENEKAWDQSPDMAEFPASFTYFSTDSDAAYVWVPEKEYVMDSDGNYDDMILNITAEIKAE